MNKKILNSAIMMLGLFLASSCTKNPEKPVVDPQPQPPVSIPKVSRIEYESNFVEATYHTDGRINTVTSKNPNGQFQQTYTFHYQNGKLDEVVFGGKWKYIYTGELITQIQTYTESGQFRFQTELIYNSNKKITEKLETKIVGGAPYPQMRTLFEYNAEGNVSKKILFQWINQGWHKSEEVSYPGYDNHPNTSEHFESNPYLPAGTFSVNNPIKEIYTDVSGPVTGTAQYEYTYDASGRPSVRKTTYTYPGLPDEIEVTKLFY